MGLKESSACGAWDFLNIEHAGNRGAWSMEDMSNIQGYKSYVEYAKENVKDRQCGLSDCPHNRVRPHPHPRVIF